MAMVLVAKSTSRLFKPDLLPGIKMIVLDITEYTLSKTSPRCFVAVQKTFLQMLPVLPPQRFL